MQHQTKRTLRRALIGLIGVCGLAALSPQTARAESDCISEAASVEQELGIPSGILASIAMVESGIDGAPYPFALSIEGRAVMARSQSDAARYLHDRRGRVRSNTYVGCMQISLKVHKSQFSSVEDIVNPRENMRYAGRLLVRLHNEEGNWRSAIARYNGASLRVAQNYVCKVWQHLNAFEQSNARLLESATCQDRDVTISPSSRRSYKSAQVAELN